MTARRSRRPAEEAKRLILEAAEKRLIDGGPDAVRVQPLARDLGITDAAIHHHFGSRDELLVALLKFGGQRLREAMREALSSGVEQGLDLDAFLTGATVVFGDRGYSRLAIWLSTAGWRDRGHGLFDPLAAAIAAERGESTSAREEEEARFQAALLVLVAMAEPIFGTAARRSVSLDASAATRDRFRSWLVDTFEAVVHR